MALYTGPAFYLCASEIQGPFCWSFFGHVSHLSRVGPPWPPGTLAGASVCHVFLLKPHVLGPFPAIRAFAPALVVVNGQEEFEVEAICDSRVRQDRCFTSFTGRVTARRTGSGSLPLMSMHRVSCLAFMAGFTGFLAIHGRFLWTCLRGRVATLTANRGGSDMRQGHHTRFPASDFTVCAEEEE